MINNKVARLFYNGKGILSGFAIQEAISVGPEIAALRSQ